MGPGCPANTGSNRLTVLINAWAEFVIAKRLYVIVGSVLLLLGILLTGPPIATDNSTERYFVTGDPALLEYENLIDVFGDNEYLIVGFEATPGTPDIFNADTLQDLAKVSAFLENHEYVTQLRSLTTFQYIHADGDDLSIDYLVEDIGNLLANPSAIEDLKSTLATEYLALDSLITRDYRHTRIAARVEHRTGTSEHKIKVVQDLFRFIEENNIISDSYVLHLSGYPFVQERLETITAEDTSVLIPIMIVLMLVILFISFRSFAATLYPWLAIACSLLIVLEIQAYLGFPHTTIDSGALAPTLIIIGIGITVHILIEFFQLLKAAKSGTEAARLTIVHIFTPAFFTAITTSAGFLALSITKIMPIREFAFLGAVGVLLLFLFSLTVLPALLSFIKVIPPNTYTVLDSGFVSRLTQKVPAFTLKYRNTILAVGIAAIVFSIWNIPSIRIDSNYVNLFKENSSTRQDIVYFDDVYRGVVTLDIILDSGEIDGIKDPLFLSQLEQIQSWLSERETLGPINSLVDYMKEIRQALNNDDPAYFRIPDSREMTAQFLLLYESSGANEDLYDMRDFNNRYARLVAPVVNMPASQMTTELNLITSYLETNYQHLQPTITGNISLKTAQEMYISQGMVQSLLIALSVITIFFIILFRSFKYGILSIIPSVLPIILAGSVAGWLGISFDIGAVIIFAMTMGIAVDDAIHVMNRYLMAKRAGASTQHSIQRAMNESGRAVVFSSIILIFGFGVLAFASISTVVYVGLFGAIIMSLALIGDLIFLPAILYLIDGSEEEVSDGQSVVDA